MPRDFWFGLCILIGLGLGLLFSEPITSAIAQGSNFSLSHNTVDNGGGTLSNGGYTLSGNIGQPEAGAGLSSGGYNLIGGTFGGAVSPSGGTWPVYLPVIVRSGDNP